MRTAAALLAILFCTMLAIPVFLSTDTFATSTASFNTFSNVNYCTMNGIKQYLNLFTPTSGSNHPVVVWIPGGGWNTTGATTYAAHTNFGNLVGNLTQHGIAVASVGYTGYPTVQWPAQIEETKCAVRFLRNNATAYGLNQYQVAAYGRSAGAHLTDLMGLASKSVGWDVGQYLTSPSTVKAVVEVSGPANLTRDSSFDPSVVSKIDTVFGMSFASELAGSPVDYRTTLPPRFLLLYGINDSKVGYDQGTNFQSYATSIGASSSVILVDNAGHGLSPIGATQEVPSISQTVFDSVDFFITAFAGTGGPSVTLSASPSAISFGQSSGATVTMSGGATPSGTLTFYAYSSCSGLTLVHTQTVTVSGDGTYSAATFTPSSTGTYFWTASYSGDASNAPSSTTCGAAGTTVAVTSNTLSLSASASPQVITYGQSASATAALSGGTSPTGTIAFTLYGASGCPTSSQVFTSTATVAGNAVYSSGSFTPAATGSFYWTAAYSGDSNNSPVATFCGASGSVLTVSTLTTNVAVTATPSSVMVGQQASASALLSSGLSPTGSITFTAYSASGCPSSSLVFTGAPVPVSGDGTYLSGSFTPSAKGTYYWVAAYSGDSINAPSTSQCGEPTATLTVGAASTSLAISVAPSTVTFGQAPSASATLSGGATPTGTITFAVFSASTCTSSSQVFSGTVAVSGDGTYVTTSFTPSSTGTYYWTASYSGDANNGASSTACGAAGSTTSVSSIPAVSSAGYTDTPTNNDPTLGSGTVVFTFTVTNYGTETFTLGGTISVASSASVSCTGGNTLSLSGSIAAGASATFSLTCTYLGSAGQAVTATSAATFTDPNGFSGAAAGNPAAVSFTIET